MNTRVQAAALPAQPARDSVSLPAGAGVALAVVLGSLAWIGVLLLLL